MPDADKAELDKLLLNELSAAWLPNPGPQTQALESKADVLLYGGAAGGGKTDLILGIASTEHHRSLIVRRESVELDGIVARSKEILSGRGSFNGTDKEWSLNDGASIKMGGMKDADSWRSYAGRPRDFMAFDEAAEFSKEQVFSLIAWLRSTDPEQRCRVLLASNPPRGGEGEWVLEEFAPWLDPLFPNPAAPGELRWAIVVGDETEWVDGPGVHKRGDEEYTAMSRTFVPARLDDNPYLKDTNYRVTLQNLPEPLRSQLLKGDFLAGRQDHEWQVIPSHWVDLANERWEKAEQKTRPMLSIATDPSGGGPDATVMARLHADAWFAPMLEWRGDECSDPNDIVANIVRHRTDNADISVDLTGGWGSGVVSHLKRNDLECYGLVFSAKSAAKTEDGKFGFINLRAEMYWKFREALDPANGNDVKLPVDSRLKAELTTPRWKPSGTSVQIEDKLAIKKRVGGSPDRADAVVMAWHRRSYGGKMKVYHAPVHHGAGSWMG